MKIIDIIVENNNLSIILKELVICFNKKQEDLINYMNKVMTQEERDKHGENIIYFIPSFVDITVIMLNLQPFLTIEEQQKFLEIYLKINEIDTNIKKENLKNYLEKEE